MGEQKVHAPVTANDLIEAMADNIRQLKAGEVTPAIVNAHVNAHASILRVMKMQMDYAKATNSTPNIPLLLTKGEDQAG
jgi:hypothetical protein